MVDLNRRRFFGRAATAAQVAAVAMVVPAAVQAAVAPSDLDAIVGRLQAVYPSLSPDSQQLLVDVFRSHLVILEKIAEREAPHA
jgi:hypothetical protein